MRRTSSTIRKYSSGAAFNKATISSSVYMRATFFSYFGVVALRAFTSSPHQRRKPSTARCLLNTVRGLFPFLAECDPELDHDGCSDLIRELQGRNREHQVIERSPIDHNCFERFHVAALLEVISDRLLDGDATRILSYDDAGDSGLGNNFLPVRQPIAHSKRDGGILLSVLIDGALAFEVANLKAAFGCSLRTALHTDASPSPSCNSTPASLSCLPSVEA